MESLSAVQILSQIQGLPKEEQRELIDQLNALVSDWDAEPRPRITDLEGLGEEIWQGIDAKDYVNQERDSWDG